MNRPFHMLIGQILLSFALLIAPLAQAEQRILIADSAKIEASSAVVARLRAQAQSSMQKRHGKTQLDAEHSEALELSLSDLRAALPEVVAQIAKAKAADVVLEPAIAKQFGLQGIDISEEVKIALDKRSEKLGFIAP